MIRFGKRWLWLGFITLICSSAFAADNDVDTPDKKPVISIELGQITYNGQPLPMWAKPAEWEKVLGKATRHNTAAGTYTWDELGVFCASGFADDGVVQLTIGLAEQSDNPHWPRKPFSGMLYVDGALVTLNSSFREINRHKTIGPSLKEGYQPTIFGYDFGPPHGPLVWFKRQGNIILNVDVNKYDIHLRKAPNAVKDAKASKNTITTAPHQTTKQQPPVAPQPEQQIQPITTAEIQEVLSEVQDSSRSKIAGNYAQILSNDADIRRDGMIETRSELIKSARMFFYSVTDYRYEQIVENIELAPDGQQATIKLTIREHFSEGDEKNIEKVSSQRWLLERVNGRVMVTELTIK